MREWTLMRRTKRAKTWKLMMWKRNTRRRTKHARKPTKEMMRKEINEMRTAKAIVRQKIEQAVSRKH